MLFIMGERIIMKDPWGITEPKKLAEILRSRDKARKVLLIDSRSFLEFNTHHIQQSVNVCCSKLVKRRLQQDKVHIKDLLTQTCHIDADETWDVIVYDQCSENTTLLTDDLFLIVLLQKLAVTFNTVSLLKGGFLGFQAMHPNLCESKTNNNYKHAPLTSLSQPCLPVSNVGPTRILPFLYLGSQRDALSQETVQVNGISYILNVSTTCPQAPFIQDGHFLRIPVNDNYSEKMQPFFHEAFQFLDTVRNSNGCVLVHCLAGISRSATLAIAYIMKNLNMSSDDAYRYVKEKRPTISPNFNFLGQLLDFEKQLKREHEESREVDTKPGVTLDLCLPNSVSISNRSDTEVRENSVTSSISFPINMTKSLSCTTSLGVPKGCPRTELIPSVVCNQIGLDEVDMEADAQTTSSFSTTTTTSIPKPPSDTHIKTGAKRANFLPLGSTTATMRKNKTLPLTNVCSPLKPKPSNPWVPCSYSPGSGTQTVHNVQSPTTALANLSFNTPTKETAKTPMMMETQMQLHKFPTTSLDKLNFTPCFVKEDGMMRKKNGAIKRPLSSSVVEGKSTETLHSPSNSSTSSAGSGTTSPTSGQAKVVLRSHGNKAKRAMVRPNSIAFSSYPNFDLGSDCQNSPCSSSNTSQDDSSEAYSSKKSRPCHFEQGTYTEKHLYKKITAAMETAMIKTQAYTQTSGKARSLDDILNSGGDETMETDCNCNSKMGKLSRRCGPRTDLFSPSGMFDHLACRCGGTPDPYQSNSSISSSGSHNSLHGSLEIIQVS